MFLTFGDLQERVATLASLLLSTMAVARLEEAVSAAKGKQDYTFLYQRHPLWLSPSALLIFFWTSAPSQ